MLRGARSFGDRRGAVSSRGGDSCRPLDSAPQYRRTTSLRFTTAAVLALWLSFLGLTWLQPCCEWLAWLVPHAHAETTVPGGKAHESSGIEVGHHVADGQIHQHCADPQLSFTRLSDTVVSVTGERGEALVLAAPVVIFFLYELYQSKITVFSRYRERGPPSPVYFATQRLRI